MKNLYPKFALTLLPIILTLTLLQGCASPLPVAVPCPKMAPVSKWMMEPSKNLYLTKPRLSELSQPRLGLSLKSSQQQFKSVL